MKYIPGFRAQKKRKKQGKAPSIPKRISSWSKALRRWQQAGRPERADEVVERLYAICSSCPNVDDDKTTCLVCGCRVSKKGHPLLNKIKMATEDCPKGRWFPQPQGIDILVPLRNRSSWGHHNELRYLLRSLEKNLPNLGRVFIVGYRPPWLGEVCHIPLEDCRGYGKDTNIMRKILAGIEGGIENGFLRCSDDQALLRQPTREELLYERWCDNLPGRDQWEKTNPVWYKRFSRTVQTLESLRLPAHLYDLHIPQRYHDKERIREVLENTDLTEPNYTVNTWLLNQVAQFPVEGYPSGLWLSYSKPTEVIQRRLQERFPQPSRFESTEEKTMVLSPSLSAPTPMPTRESKRKPALAFLCCDRYDYTKQTLESFFEYNRAQNWSLYYADDASTDPRVTQLVESYGFIPLLKNKERVGCTPTTRALVRAVAAKTAPETPILYLQNDFVCCREVPMPQLRSLLTQDAIGHVQLSYRRPRNPYFQGLKWKTENGKPWDFGDQKTSEVVFCERGTGLGYHPSIAYAKTWADSVPDSLKQEKDFIRHTAKLGFRACRLTAPVFRHIGKHTTPDGLFGLSKKNKRARTKGVGQASYSVVPFRGAREGKKLRSRNSLQAGVSLCQVLSKLLLPGMRTLECGSGLTTYLFLAFGCKHTALEHLPQYAPDLPGIVQICSIRGKPPWYAWKPPRTPFDLILIDGPPGKIGRSGILSRLPNLTHPGTVVLVDDTDRENDAALANQIAEKLHKPMRVVEAQHKYDFKKSFTIIG